MSKKHIFHRENCASCIRDVAKDLLGRTLVLTGKHAFEWSLCICDENSTLTITYSNRAEARKEFNRRKEKRHE